MNPTEIKRLKAVFKRHGFVMKTAELSRIGINKIEITRLCEMNVIEKVKHGYYHWSQDFVGGDVAILRKIFPNAIFCMETAAFYYRYTDRTPNQWNFAIKRNLSHTHTEIYYPFIKAYRTQDELLQLGVVDYEIDGFKVKMYDRDRTICDFLRRMNDIDPEIFNKVILGYVNDPRRNIPNLMKYAKELRVTEKVKRLIGVWL